MLALSIPLVWLLALAPLQQGDRAPTTLNLVGLDGRRLNLDLTGTVTIVDFFATWCPSCRNSVAGYDKLMARHGDHLRIIVVDVGEPREVVRRFFAQRRLPEGVIVTIDPNGSVQRAFGATSLPSFYVLDPGGVVRTVHTGWGGGSADDLSEWIDFIRGKTPPRVKASGKKRAPSTREEARAADDDRARRLGVEILR